MKKSLILILLAFLLAPLAAQRTYKPTPGDFKTLFASRTYVVLDASLMSDYNIAIREAVEASWDLTEYEFLEPGDLGNKLQDSTASFLIMTGVNLERDKSRARYNFLCLSLGGKDVLTVDDLRDVANLPYSYYDIEEDHYMYHLNTLVRFLQQHVRTLAQNPSLVSQNVYQFYNEDMGKLKDKVLYLVKEELAPDIQSEKDISSVYPYPFEIVDRETVIELIGAGDEKAVFLHKVGPQQKNIESMVYKLILGVSDARLYYYNYHKANSKNPDAILKNDLKRIGKAPN